MTAEDLALVITVPLVTFIFCCVLLYHRKKIADVCGGASCFRRRSRGRPSGSSARAAQYAARTPQPPSGETRDEPATTPDSARWASSQPPVSDPWTEPEPLSPAAASPVGHASASAASLPRDALVPSPFGGDVLDAFLAFDENEIPIIV